MIGWLIVACEIGFWIFVLAGLFTRYVLKQKKAGAVLLWCTPIVDLVLIIATIIDLQNGQAATFFHGLAAYYIGMTIAFGHRAIQWADAQFLYRFANGPKPLAKKLYGAAHAKQERKGWYRHAGAWFIGNLLLLAIILLVGDKEQTEELFRVASLWALVLGVDFLWSFSYSVFPKKEKTA